MACDYSVVGVHHVTTKGPLGNYVSAQEVTFTTKGSGPQKITIPDTDFNDETVKAAIEARCTAIDSVLNLGK